MKRIGIDARLYSKTGVGVYIRNMLYYLARRKDPDIHYMVYCMTEDTLKFKLPQNRFTIRPCAYRWHTYGEQLGFYYMLMFDKLDLMHFTYFSYPVLYRRKFIATIHDTILLEYKTGKASTNSRLLYEFKHALFRHVFESQIQNAACIITPTDTVREKLINLSGTPRNKHIETIYEGVDYELLKSRPNTALKKQYGTGFLLYVGNFYPHKNIERLVRAYRLSHINIPLIMVGPDDFFSRRIQTEIDRSGMSGRILMQHNVAPGDLAFYYSNARSLIHPSMAEGFGLPLIEAAYYNLPVVASNIPVFKELLGSKFVSFDPYDEEDIVTRISETVMKQIVPDYSDITKQFSFERMTDKIVNIYRTYS